LVRIPSKKEDILIVEEGQRFRLPDLDLIGFKAWFSMIILHSFLLLIISSPDSFKTISYLKKIEDSGLNRICSPS